MGHEHVLEAVESKHVGAEEPDAVRNEPLGREAGRVGAHVRMGRDGRRRDVGLRQRGFGADRRRGFVRADELDVIRAMDENELVVGPIGIVPEGDVGDAGALLGAKDRERIGRLAHVVDEELDPGRRGAGERNPLAPEAGNAGRKIDFGLPVNLVRKVGG